MLADTKSRNIEISYRYYVLWHVDTLFIDSEKP